MSDDNQRNTAANAIAIASGHQSRTHLLGLYVYVQIFIQKKKKKQRQSRTPRKCCLSIFVSNLDPEEKKDNAVSFITKHNSLFEWCYVDHLIIPYFGYLPQHIIGKSIFAHYNIDDLTTIKEIHQNSNFAKKKNLKQFSSSVDGAVFGLFSVSTPRNIPYKGNPYRFKCQNGDFALVQTEWSNFVNPWSGRVDFVIGKHKVIQVISKHTYKWF